MMLYFFFSSRRRHTRFDCDWSSDVCSSDLERFRVAEAVGVAAQHAQRGGVKGADPWLLQGAYADVDRKSTRLNSSHSQISYAVFCLKKKNSHARTIRFPSRRTAWRRIMPLH